MGNLVYFRPSPQVSQINFSEATPGETDLEWVLLVRTLARFVGGWGRLPDPALRPSHREDLVNYTHLFDDAQIMPNGRFFLCLISPTL